MPAFAPRTAVQAQLHRGQQAREAHYPGRILIAGVGYDGMLHLGPAEPSIEASTGAVWIVQRGEAHVLRSAMKQPPKRGSVLRIAGMEHDFTVESVTASLHTPEWVIKFQRLPPKS